MPFYSLQDDRDGRFIFTGASEDQSQSLVWSRMQFYQLRKEDIIFSTPYTLCNTQSLVHFNVGREAESFGRWKGLLGLLPSEETLPSSQLHTFFVLHGRMKIETSSCYLCVTWPVWRRWLKKTSSHGQLAEPRRSRWRRRRRRHERRGWRIFRSREARGRPCATSTTSSTAPTKISPPSR